MEADFSGYATKAGLKCSDGRTITPEAFKHQDKMTVPLVWQHGHNSSDNVLGHAILEAREDGVYAYGYFNDTASGQNASKLVQHKDIKALSIYANQLVEKSKLVVHGAIREVSLVLSGANPGAFIDYVRVAHGDGPDNIEILDDEAIISTGLELEHSQPGHAATLAPPVVDGGDGVGDSPDATLQEIYDTLNEQQKEVVHYMIGAALDGADGSVAHAEEDPTNATVQQVYDSFSDQEKLVVQFLVGAAVDEVIDSVTDPTGSEDTASASHSNLNNQEGTKMTNVFEQGGASAETKTLSHDQLKAIVDDAQRLGSLKESFIVHAAEYGIEDIDVLFPDALVDGSGIQLLSRRMEWVQNVLSSTKHSPFSRIKSLVADITAEEARAKGYVKGNLKKDEVIKMLKRITTPKTIYKKQKLDRDDIVDITSLDIVAWLKGEMRLMLDEEIARAILVGDNRAADDEDKIDEDHIRPIAYDIDMYNTTIQLAPDAAGDVLVDALVGAMSKYKGSGNPVLYTTTSVYTGLILAKDTLGRRLYATKAELAAALLVSDIVMVEAMEQDSDLVGVVVNLIDYTIGADNGGAVTMFENFDIDYNQQRYLIESRISGALTRPKSALTLKKASGRIVTPSTPTFVTSTGVLTIPTQAGTVYTNEATGTTLTAGAQAAIASGATIEVLAIPAAGYGFTHDSVDEWAFTRD